MALCYVDDSNSIFISVSLDDLKELLKNTFDIDANFVPAYTNYQIQFGFFKNIISSIFSDYCPSHTLLCDHLKLTGNTALARLGFTPYQWTNKLKLQLPNELN